VKRARTRSRESRERLPVRVPGGIDQMVITGLKAPRLAQSFSALAQFVHCLQEAVIAGQDPQPCLGEPVRSHVPGRNDVAGKFAALFPDPVPVVLRQSRNYCCLLEQQRLRPFPHLRATHHVLADKGNECSGYYSG